LNLFGELCSDLSIEGNIEQNFWEIARNYRNQLKSQIENPDFLKKLSVGSNQPTVEFVCNNCFPQILNDPRCGGDRSFVLSNIGKINIEQNNDLFFVEGIYSLVPMVGCGTSIFIGIHSIGEAMHLAFSFPDPLVNRKTIEKLSDEFVSILCRKSSE